MNSAFEIKSSLPAYQKIETDLRDKIKSGFYNVGDRLPTEKEMSIKYDVSRGTLKKAIALLCEEGLISQIPGRGSFVCSFEQALDIRAKRLRTHKAQTHNKSIAVLIPNITESLYPEIVRGVEDKCHEKGYKLLIGNYDATPEKERKYMVDFSEADIAGMIISPSYNSYQNDFYKQLRKRGIPFVLTDVSVAGVEADLVSNDNIEGAYQATKCLISSGCGNIAFFCGWLSVSSSQERWLGYKRALIECGVKENRELLREGDFTESFGYEAAKEILSNHHIDGILSANEPITNGLIRAVSEMKDTNLKLASFDNPIIPHDFRSDIVVISQQRYEIGKTAVELLFKRLDGGEMPFRKVLIEPKKEFKTGWSQ